jgi:hypothetical protein
MLTILVHEVYTKGQSLHFLGCQENGEIIEGTMPTRDRDGEPCMEVIPTSGFEGMTLDEVKKNWGWGAPLKDVIEVKPWGDDFIESLFPKTATRWFIPI